MAGGQQLGALVSLIQGLDMSPIQNARNTSLQAQTLGEQKRAQRAQEALGKQQLDLARQSSQEGAAIDREELGLGYAQLESSEKQAGEQRDLARTLQEMKDAGQVNLADIRGAQEIAQINLRATLEKAQQDDLLKFEEQQQDRLFKLKGDAFEHEITRRAAEEERSYQLNKLRGIDPGADSQLAREINTIQKLRLEKQKEWEDKHLMGELTDIAKHEKEMRRLTQIETNYKLTKIYRELVEADPNSTEAKAIKELQKRMMTTEVEQAEQTTKIQAKQLEQFEKDTTKDAEAGFLSEDAAAAGVVPRGAVKFLTVTESDTLASLTRKAGQEGFWDTDIGYSTGNQVALNALNSLESFGDAQDQEAVNARKALREAAKLAAKLGKGQIGGAFSDTARVMGEPGFGLTPGKHSLAEKEAARLKELVDLIEDEYGIELVD